MKSVRILPTVFAFAALVVTGEGCGSSGPPPACGTSDSCNTTDLPCSRSCGRGGQVRICECGTGTMEGQLICSDCMSGGGSGGRVGNGSGGRFGGGSGGRMGGGSGGRMGGGSGGRMGGGSGGRVGGGSGGSTGSGGSQSSDAGTPACPAGALAGNVACTPTATPVCQTECVNQTYSICSCPQGVGTWVCPGGIPCP